ncbi:MAG: AGE family epimerase/isomerase [Gemmatimonadota bacterium]|nr:AGE family epimerase/isomerase [Gemmatimonadota bacterium]
MPSMIKFPETIAGMNLEELKADYRDRLFGQYLPFWEKGGIDTELGGFICHLEDDGSPADDEKNIWFQGRGLWVYSFLYNNFGHDPKWLGVARKARNFMAEHMWAGSGRWYEIVHRDGTVIEPVSTSVYGWLFAANGLVEYYKATGSKQDLDLVLETLRAALTAYDKPDYEGVFLPEGITAAGVRTQGYSMVILRLLTQVLAIHPDPDLEALAKKHADLIMNRFYNPEYGIANEYLAHDYSRLEGLEDQMFTGHAIEVLWMVMLEAVRKKDRALFDTACLRLKRYLDMSWDNVFEGFGSGDYRVFGGPGRQQGTDYGVKTMWLQCEVMLACMLVLEYTGADWARQWYEKTREFTLRTVAAGSPGVWDQAVGRRGEKIARKEYHPKRRGNFHQPRYMMMTLLILEQMIESRGELASFPS